MYARNYYRMMSDAELVAQTTTYGGDELAIVLAERLEVLSSETDNFEARIRELEDEVNLLKIRADGWQADFVAANNQLNALLKREKQNVSNPKRRASAG